MSSGRWVVRRSLLLGTLASVIASLLGALVVTVLLVVVLPTPAGTDAVVIKNIAVGGGYVVVAVAIGIVGGVRRARHRMRWLLDDREPTAGERDATVGVPWAITRVQLLLWFAATVLFFGLNAGTSVLLATEVALTVLIGGLASAASSYLMVERINRPVLARAMAGAPLRQKRGTGVTWRTLGSWALGTALPVTGVVLLSGLALGMDIDRRELALSTFVLGLIALVVGLLIMVFLARSIADPLKALRRALIALAEGDTTVRVPVFDSTEVGVLQTGFNQMVAGLEERDRIRDLFGRHVGHDVAVKALEAGVVLGGEVRQVAVLFVDVVGSTTLAEERAATEVVERLNAFLGAVIEVVSAHDGTINSFQGDAALAVWGAPLSHPDPHTAALLAARTLADRLRGDDGLLPAGIGVAAGKVVAGNIGAAERLQYTVIGDPVNQAARLTERAKAQDARVLASAAVVEGADAGEQDCWTVVGEEVLRGRTTPTQVWAPLG